MVKFSYGNSCFKMEIKGEYINKKVGGAKMNFISTRGEEPTISSSEAIIKGIANDGGLYVPNEFPEVYDRLKKKMGLSYIELAYEVIKEFFGDIGEENLKGAIDRAYNGKFSVREENDFLELYHGPTSAFKDAALLFLPQIMKEAKKLNNIQEGNNVKVIGIRGNFDNAQSGVKKIFGDVEFREELKNRGFLLSSANSINIGRLVPQIVYYFYGYFDLVNKQKIKEGDEINIVVPTGNFGNILAAYYGKKMGLPIGKLICSSNENNVLTDFLNTGLYDRRRELILTESPSMDILVSSNLERLIFEANNRDAKKTKKLMDELNEKGVYSISSESKAFLSDFYGNYANTDEVYEAIKNVYNNKKYLMDTHTAVGYVVFNKYRKETGDNRQALIASTASPYKFPRSICNALELDVSNKDDFEILKLLNEYTNIEIPKNLVGLNNKKILHNNVCDKEKMKDILLEFLKESKND